MQLIFTLTNQENKRKLSTQLSFNSTEICPLNVERTWKNGLEKWQ
jgi:hypothetical protein